LLQDSERIWDCTKGRLWFSLDINL